MHPLDVVSADQLITSPGQRVHPHPAVHERIELAAAEGARIDGGQDLRRLMIAVQSS